MVDPIVDIGIAKGPDFIEDKVGIKLRNAIFLHFFEKFLIDAFYAVIADDPGHSTDGAKGVYGAIPFIPVDYFAGGKEIATAKATAFLAF